MPSGSSSSFRSTPNRESADISTRRNGLLLKSIACLGAPAAFASAKFLIAAIFAASQGFTRSNLLSPILGVSVGLQAVNAMPERIQRLNAFFETYRSGDKYDREALTHVMACSSHFPGNLIRGFG